MKNTTLIGARTEGIILAALLSAGYTVLVPFGGGLRYDLVIETPTGFQRVQCKTARFRFGAVCIPTANCQRDSGKAMSYKGHADFIAAYCAATKKVYLVPIAEVGGRECALRTEIPKNNQVARIRWAKDYEIGRSI